MKQSLQLDLKSSIFDRPRRLVIDKNYIEFDDNDLISKGLTKFDKEDIIAFRFGVEWISGYSFMIGRIYCVDIQNKENKIIKLRLKAIYRIRNKQLREKYSKIVHALYDHFFNDISRNYLTKFDNKEDFDLAGVYYFQAGLKFNKESDLIPWDDIGTASYKTYHTIYRKSNPTEYKAFEYLLDWNSGIVYSVSRQILKNKGIVDYL